MKRIIGNTIQASALVALIVVSSQAIAGDSGLSFTTGLDYSSGKYGGTQSTDITYIPLTGKYETGRWVFQLTVPYVRITGPGNVTQGGIVLRSGQTTRTTQSGLGDIVAGATYNAYAGNGPDPLLIDLTGKVKFGTADEKKGLGTGSNDYAAQVDMYKGMGQFTALGTVGYKVFGNAPGLKLDNVFYGSVGGVYKISQQTSGGLILDLRQKVVSTGASQRDVTAFISHKINQDWKAQVYAVNGFSNASPDWGAGAMLTRIF
ncbi:MAG: transporter family protein [Sulfuriferula sp.]